MFKRKLYLKDKRAAFMATPKASALFFFKGHEKKFRKMPRHLTDTAVSSSCSFAVYITFAMVIPPPWEISNESSRGWIGRECIECFLLYQLHCRLQEHDQQRSGHQAVTA